MLEIISSVHLFTYLEPLVHLFLLYFVDNSNVVPISDIWFIGDSFVNDYYHALPMMVTQARKDKSDPPDIYKQYTVKCFTSSPSTKMESVPARIVNSIVKALNDTHKLPRFIIIIPDWDLLRYFDHSTYGVEAVTHCVVGWMISNIIKAIEM